MFICSKVLIRCDCFQASLEWLSRLGPNGQNHENNWAELLMFINSEVGHRESMLLFVEFLHLETNLVPTVNLHQVNIILRIYGPFHYIVFHLHSFS